MKSKILLSVLLIFSFTQAFSQTPCSGGMAGSYPCSHVDLLAFMELDEIDAGQNTSDIWGWKSPVTGKEYALVGCYSGTAFVDISDPVNPVYLGLLYSHTSGSLWRDVEDFNNFAFIVSEASGHGLQVFDLLQLDEVTNPPVNFDETEHYGGFGHCHTIDICQETGYAYCNGTSTYNGGLHIVNINDPLSPELAGSYGDDGYTHDCHAVLYDGPDADYVGSEIVMACNEDALTIVNCTDKTDCYDISINEYPETGYTHQGWFSKDKRYFMVDDELDEMDFDNNTRTHIFDVQDLDNVQYVGHYQASIPSIDHNLYVKDQFVFESNYTSGVRILDAIKVENGVLGEIAFFDLFPGNNNANFQGTWSNYPFLPSGVVLATSMYEGFFILKPRILETEQTSWQLCGDDELSFEIDVLAHLNFPLVSGLSGLPDEVDVSSSNITEEGSYLITISNLLTLAPGVYNFNLQLINAQGNSYDMPLSIEISEDAAIVPTNIAPANDADIPEATNIVFEWNAQANASTYMFQLATDDAFTSIVDQQDITGTTYDPLIDLPQGTYYWRVKAINECGESGWSETSVFTLFITNVNYDVAVQLHAFPNPANDQITVTGTTLNGGNIQIHDATGRLVLNMKPAAGITRLDVSHLVPGMYVVSYQGLKSTVEIQSGK